MRPFTFLLMLLLQRLDETMRHEARRMRRDETLLAGRQRRRRHVLARLRRSALPHLAGS